VLPGGAGRTLLPSNLGGGCTFSVTGNAHSGFSAAAAAVERKQRAAMPIRLLFMFPRAPSSQTLYQQALRSSLLSCESPPGTGERDVRLAASSCRPLSPPRAWRCHSGGTEGRGERHRASDPDDLAPIDEFHNGQRSATIRLARLAGVSGSEKVLDVGCGIGGP